MFLFTFVCSLAYGRNVGMFHYCRCSSQSSCHPLSGIFEYSCYVFAAEIRLFRLHMMLEIFDPPFSVALLCQNN